MNKNMGYNLQQIVNVGDLLDGQEVIKILYLGDIQICLNRRMREIARIPMSYSEGEENE